MRDSGRISVVGRESLSGIAIAFAVHSLDHSLFIRLIPSYKFSMKNGYLWHDEML